MKAKHFVWSMTANALSIGSNVLTSSSRSIPTCSATAFRASFRSTTFSNVITPETSATSARSFWSTPARSAIFSMLFRTDPYTAWKQLTVPCESQVYLESIPYPVSTVRIGNSTNSPSTTLNFMNTSVARASSSPRTIVSRSGPAFPPPDHTSSL